MIEKRVKTGYSIPDVSTPNGHSTPNAVPHDSTTTAFTGLRYITDLFGVVYLHESTFVLYHIQQEIASLF